ncbi:protein-L-isoaspartate O-methyltransferase [Leeia sp. TBRC 13508]|uniref:Protein-L-isoaspartate O-methyltransferase n=1 Tax=Leeia speluncae TaxID=2884804 RepID=A0ABS8D5G4_9NEIS|nr:protein-L-isoaspartate O-methyltransferase [Leeia speluncae]MCB6183407.1 protein-L-isoaspartate O-methyltransferase [Leeia speluncae]
MDLAQARFNMVEQQIRPAEVLDEKVLDLLLVVKREDFIPEAWRNLAFVDMETPIKADVRTLPPRIEARLVQEVAVKPTDKILEVGTGCGYTTALLAKLGRHVYSVDIDPELTEMARANLDKAGIRNVTLETGDAAQGWAANAPYDIIVISGSVPVLPTQFVDQLNRGGRIFAIVGDAPIMRVTVFTKEADGKLSERQFMETVVTPLTNAAQPKRFSF